MYEMKEVKRKWIMGSLCALSAASFFAFSPKQAAAAETSGDASQAASVVEQGTAPAGSSVQGSSAESENGNAGEIQAAQDQRDSDSQAQQGADSQSQQDASAKDSEAGNSALDQSGVLAPSASGSDSASDSDAALNTDSDAASNTGAGSTYNTIWHGIDLSSIFDYNYYKNQYSDLQKAFGEDESAYLNHFATFGLSEGRTAKADFASSDYDSFQDSIAPIWAQVKSGKAGSSTKNGVDYSKVYDYIYYAYYDGDVSTAMKYDPAGMLNHFVVFGMQEQRQASTSFNEKPYRLAYQDLRLAFRNNYPQYYLHYINYGSKEGRSGATGVTTLQDPVTTWNGTDYSPVYDYYYYTGKYADLKKAFGEDDIAAVQHFATFGMQEQRQGISSFDEVSYRHAYQDLRLAFQKVYPQYYLHYINHGVKEGRSQVTGISRIQNGVTVYHGIDLSAAYDYTYYTDHYSDLQKAYGEDDVNALEHFVIFGAGEGRSSKENADQAVYQKVAKLGTLSRNASTVYKGIGFGSVYDYFYYAWNNGDVVSAYKADPDGVLSHFVTFGLNEGRQGKASYSASDYSDRKNVVKILVKNYKNGWLKYSGKWYLFSTKGDVEKVQAAAPRLISDGSYYISPMITGTLNTASERIEAMIQKAYEYLNAGTHYLDRYAQAPGNNIDCSGLVMQSLLAAGYDTTPIVPSHHILPQNEYDARNMFNMYTDMPQVSFANLKRGDIVFYSHTGSNWITHVAIYLGNGKVIESYPPRVMDKYGVANSPHPHIYGIRRPFV